MSVCYCDGYGICFGDAEKFDYYFELEYHLDSYRKELNATMAKQIPADEDKMPHDQHGRTAWLNTEIERIEGDMKMRKTDAFEKGTNAAQRAREAGRIWIEGDGF